MSKKLTFSQLIPLLRASIFTYTTNPIILYPLVVLAFIQLLTLEILYFAPRYPLSIFFGPIIEKIWSGMYLHYPFNFVLLPKLFYYANIPISILIGSFLSGVTIAIVVAVDRDKRTNFRSAFREVLPSYIHIFLAACIALMLYTSFSKGYEWLHQALSLHDAEAGFLAWLRDVVIGGASYFNFILGVFSSTLLIFVIPAIVVEKTKIFDALIINFKTLFRAFLFVFCLIFLPTLMYIPVLLLRNNLTMAVINQFPMIQVIGILLSIVVIVLIDATTLTATTIFYLQRREKS